MLAKWHVAMPLWWLVLRLYKKKKKTGRHSAFISVSLVTDNTLVAFETLHTMDNWLKGKEGFMALNLYMSKAYDRVG